MTQLRIIDAFTNPQAEGPMMDGLAVHAGEWASFQVVSDQDGELAWTSTDVDVETRLYAVVTVTLDGRQGGFPDPLVPVDHPLLAQVRGRIVSWWVDVKGIEAGEGKLYFRLGEQPFALAVRVLPERTPKQNLGSLIGVSQGDWYPLGVYPYHGADSADEKLQTKRAFADMLRHYGLGAYNDGAFDASGSTAWRRAVEGRPVIAWHADKTDYQKQRNPGGGDWWKPITRPAHVLLNTFGKQNFANWLAAQRKLYNGLDATPYVLFDEPQAMVAGKRVSVPLYTDGNPPSALPLSSYAEAQLPAGLVVRFMLDVAAIVREFAPEWHVGAIVPTGWYSQFFDQLGSQFDTLVYADNEFQHQHGYQFEPGHAYFRRWPQTWAYYTDSAPFRIDSPWTSRKRLGDRMQQAAFDGWLHWCSVLYNHNLTARRNPWSGVDDYYGNYGVAQWFWPPTLADPSTMFDAQPLPSVRLAQVRLEMQRVRYGEPPVWTPDSEPLPSLEHIEERLTNLERRVAVLEEEKAAALAAARGG